MNIERRRHVISWSGFLTNEISSNINNITHISNQPTSCFQLHANLWSNSDSRSPIVPSPSSSMAPVCDLVCKRPWFIVHDGQVNLVYDLAAGIIVGCQSGWRGGGYWRGNVWAFSRCGERTCIWKYTEDGEQNQGKLLENIHFACTQGRWWEYARISLVVAFSHLVFGYF